MAISNEYITKIEGHGNLSVDWSSNKVKLNVHEGERLFEGLLVGRPAEEAFWITPRICGVCPIAHNLASVRALEDAYGIKVSETTDDLRKLMVVGQMIQSHVLHLFFLVLPDYIGLDSAVELAGKDPKAFANALALKELGDEIATIVAGRNVHPTTTTIGGFHKIPTKEALTGLLEKFKKTQKQAEWVLTLFSGLEYPKLNVDLELVALRGNEIVSNKGAAISIKDYKQNIEEELRDYSTAKFGKLKGKEMLIGSLARLINLEDLEASPPFGGEASKPGLDAQNPFHNILAQATEIVLYHKEGIEIIKKLLGMDMDAKPTTVVGESNSTTVVELRGIGAIEAPRGGLYHEYHLDANGMITYANLITPTVQNLTSIEKSAQALLEQHADKSQTEKERLLNMLVRAYDPCITCAVH